MIKSWKNKGLKQFYLTSDKAGINPSHTKRLTIILQLLDAAEEPEALNLPGFYFQTKRKFQRVLFSKGKRQLACYFPISWKRCSFSRLFRLSLNLRGTL